VQQGLLELDLAAHCNTHTATHCTTLQYAEQGLLELNLAAHCNTHTATRCNTLQYTEQGLLELNLRQNYIGDAGAKVFNVCCRVLLRICRAFWRECRALLRLYIPAPRHVTCALGLFCGYVGLFCGNVGLFCKCT